MSWSTRAVLFPKYALQPTPFFKTMSPEVARYQMARHAGMLARRMTTVSAAALAASSLLPSEQYRELFKSWKDSPTNLIFHPVGEGVWAYLKTGNWSALTPAKGAGIAALAAAAGTTALLTGSAITESDVQKLTDDVLALEGRLRVAVPEDKEKIKKELSVAKQRVRVHYALVEGKFGTKVFFRELRRLVGMQDGPLWEAVTGIYGDPDNEYEQAKFWRSITHLALGSSTLGDLLWIVGGEYGAVTAESAEEGDLNSEQRRYRRKLQKMSAGVGGAGADPGTRVMQGEIPYQKDWDRAVAEEATQYGLGPLRVSPIVHFAMLLFGIRPHYFSGSSEETRALVRKNLSSWVREDIEPARRKQIRFDIQEKKRAREAFRSAGDLEQAQAINYKITALQKKLDSIDKDTDSIIEGLFSSFVEPIEMPEQMQYPSDTKETE